MRQLDRRSMGISATGNSSIAKSTRAPFLLLFRTNAAWLQNVKPLSWILLLATLAWSVIATLMWLDSAVRLSYAYDEIKFLSSAVSTLPRLLSPAASKAQISEAAKENGLAPKEFPASHNFDSPKGAFEYLDFGNGVYLFFDGSGHLLQISVGHPIYSYPNRMGQGAAASPVVGPRSGAALHP